MEIKSETEPGQELLSQKSSHERNGESSHEPTEDESDQKSFKNYEKPGSDNNTGQSPRGLRIPSLPISTTSYEFIGDLSTAEGEAFFVDGSRYEGTWDSLGMAGVGSYRMPHEVLYLGEMRDGMQHGKGSLEYPGKQVIDGVWARGELEKWKYTFSDGLIFETENWAYCRFPDRRFYQSKMKGLNPAGRSLKTQYQPTKVIPSGCYDSGDGIFDPSTLCVTNFEQPSKIIRIPSAKESQWIMTNCRRGGTEPSGYRPWLNENWSPTPPELPYRLPMSDDSPERWWKRIFTFEKDSNLILNERRRYLEKGEDGSGGSPEGRTGCVCIPEGLEMEPETSFDVCGEAGVCGDKNSDEELDVLREFGLRELVCEEMTDSDQEYRGEDQEDLLMTVCRPPEIRMTTRPRRSSKSIKSLDSVRGEVEKEEEKETETGKEREGAEETGAAVEEKEGEDNESSNESETDNWGEKEQQLGEGFINEWEEEVEGEYHLDDLTPSDEILREKSTEGVYDFGPLKQRLSEDFDRSMPASKKRPVLRKRKPEGFQKIRPAKIGLKKQKKRSCPIVEDTEQLLQRRVGDLLFSPALDAPRSPIHLVRKECDRNSCTKCKTKPPKYEKSKCGVASLSPVNCPARGIMRRARGSVCKRDVNSRDNLDSENKNICSSSKPFITI